MRRPAGVLLAAVVGAVGLVSADAGWAQPSASAPDVAAPGTTVRRAPRPVDWQLTVEAPSPLDDLLMENLDLARYQREARQTEDVDASAEGDDPAPSALRITRGELRRLLAQVPTQARALLEAEGYFAARVRITVDDGTGDGSGTAATVDAQAHTASLFLVADSGPAFSFGEVRIEGLERQPPSAILNLAPFRPGQPYRERQVLDWQERLQKVNLFESVYVGPAFDVNHPEATPLIVQVRESPIQEASVGIGASSDNGPRVSFEHLHRNPFDLDWQVRTKVQLGVRVSDGLIDLLSHPWPGRKRGLASVQASSIEDNDNAITRTQRLKVGRP